ncbi:MAG: SDR family NAD(P)-dependent oxidoreductase [Rhodospirillaceae bacterium]|nr:SDR family NAD(P)-dependent oxidoreductase [Rhodospirillaceae bacterium]
MNRLNGRTAVLTGGGTGMGRELARQLSAAGCHVAMCDVSAGNMEQTRSLCEADAPAGVRVTTHLADVSVESEVLRFRDEVVREHEAGCVHFVFNNAGIAGAGSVIADDRQRWERTFNVCWYGVYYSTRAFLPLLIAADEGHLVNTSSVNGFFASGGEVPHVSYSAAKFAVKGFTEGLIGDLAIHAPHVKASLVMPGYVGTSILANSAKVLGNEPNEMAEDELEALRERFEHGGGELSHLTTEEIRQSMLSEFDSFRDNAPMTAAEAARIILEAVLAGRWRILVGDDARILDGLVRAEPEEAYTAEFFERYRARTTVSVPKLSL